MAALAEMLAGLDPETAGAVASSNAMQPAVDAHFQGLAQQLADWGQQQDAMKQRLAGQPLSQQALDPEALQSAMSVALSTGPGAIRAYHGSPFDFDAFDASKIGTGEGAQAYGHGLYFAENPATAEAYKNGVLNIPVIDAANKRMSEIAHEMDNLRKPGTYREFTDPRGYDLANEYDQLMAEKTKPGRMYEVNINADPAQFLNWDKPLSEQRDAAQQFFADPRQVVFKPHMTGAELYRLIDEPGTGAASDAMLRGGIPGIRYLDQGSRGAGDGTSNYVVFNPKIIDIVRKYGLAGLMASGAVASGLPDQK